MRIFSFVLVSLIANFAGTFSPALAQPSDPAPPSQSSGTTSVASAEKDAFNSAKELGTADAWNAFLTAYPNGFHADLARAYIKKLEGTAPAAAPANVAAPAGSAREISCSELRSVRSLNSDASTRVTFVNTSGAYRSIHWVNFKGELQSYGGVNSGDEVTYDTFVTHPWMIATGPGDCLQVFLPDTAPARITLERLAADDPPVKKVKKAKTPVVDDDEDEPVRKKQKKAEKKEKLVCAENYKLRKGECVLIQNCGANAYRSPEGDCYCNKNYMMKNGTCIWKQDKQGFEVAPWKKSGCKGLQKQCSQGNGKACMKYEETCQVN